MMASFSGAARLGQRWRQRLWIILTRMAATPPPERLTGVSAGEVGSSPAAQLGKTEQFETLFWKHERAIFGYLWHMTSDEQAAHDLAQETFLRAWQHFDTLITHAEPAHWLFRVATNLALNLRRHQALPAARAASMEQVLEPASSDPSGHFVERDLVRQILQELPPRQRTTLILCEIYGFKRAEVAGFLGISLDAVHMALWRAHAQFRARYLEEARQP